MVKHEDKSTGDDSVYSVYEVHCTTDYPPRVYFVGMEILYGVLSGRKSLTKDKKTKKKKQKGRSSTDLASYVFNKSRPEKDINYKYKDTKGKLV